VTDACLGFALGLALGGKVGVWTAICYGLVFGCAEVVGTEIARAIVSGIRSVKNRRPKPSMSDFQ